MMNIEVNLFASLSRYKPEGAGWWAWENRCDEGQTVTSLLQQLNVPLKEVKLIFLNGIHAKEYAVLKDGDRLGVFPPVGGG